MKPAGITMLAMTILLALGLVPAFPAVSQAPSQAYFEGPWEREPNNSYQQANGPLRSHRTYYGYPNDLKDYFSIYLYRAGTITVDLSGHSGRDVQLQLFYQSTANLVADVRVPPYHLEYTGDAGTYYIYINTGGGYNTSTRYTLRATFPMIHKVHLPTIRSDRPNRPPNRPSGPSPADGAMDQSVDVKLSWSGGDPDGDAVTYDVYLEAGDSIPDRLVCNDVSSASCDPDTLSWNAHCYWQVVATDSLGATTTGPVWDFSTEDRPNDPPNRPANPSPADGATEQSVDVKLSWSGGDPDGDAVTYDVYLEAGDSTPDRLLCNDISTTSCNPGTLGEETHYYWQVVAEDARGATRTGPVWDFHTEWSPPSDMVLVPAGEFTMGSTGGDSDEQPVHTVYLDAYAIDRYEVTNSQYATFLNIMGNQVEGGSTWLEAGEVAVRIHQVNGVWKADAGYEEHPVSEVTWYGARAYCTWAVKRLPTEAEWEKAARGTDGRSYPWGNQVPDCSRANYGFCVGDTTPVGSYPRGASPYGALDMAGNHWEWANDWFSSSYYSISPYHNPPGPASGSCKVLRGGAWYNGANLVRAVGRGCFEPWHSDDTDGFRCAESPGQ